MLGIAFELLAQPSDVDVDRPGVAIVVGSPHAIQQLATRECPARMPGKELQQSELLWTEVGRPALATKLTRVEVKIDTVGHSQSVVDARGPCLVGDERQAPPELTRVNVEGEGRVEAHTHRLQTGGDLIRPVKEHGAHARTAAAFGGHELYIGGGSRGHAEDHDTRAVTEEGDTERRRLRRRPHPIPGRRRPQAVDLRSLGEGQPIGSSRDVRSGGHEPQRGGRR